MAQRIGLMVSKIKVPRYDNNYTLLNFDFSLSSLLRNFASSDMKDADKDESRTAIGRGMPNKINAVL